MEREVRLRIEFVIGRAQAGWLLLAALMLSCATDLSSESLVLSTYYPAPLGVYRSLITTGVGPANTLLARDNGYVGIGTATPGFALDVNTRNATDGGINISGAGNASGYGDMGIHLQNSGTNGKSWYIDSTNDGSSYGGGSLVFTQWYGTPTMALTKDGNVGIGTTDPTSTVGMSGGGLTVNGSGPTHFAVLNGGSAAFALNVGTDGTWTMYDHAGGNWNSALNSQSGTIYIPTGDLHVQKGNIYVDAGNITVNGSYGSNGWVHVGAASLLGTASSSVPCDAHRGDPGDGANACGSSNQYATWLPGVWSDGFSYSPYSDLDTTDCVQTGASGCQSLLQIVKAAASMVYYCCPEN
jgi:hypothetical protein